MRNIFQIVQRLTKEEKRNFKLYLSRIETKEDKRVELLFDEVDSMDHSTDDELWKTLYPNGSKNAYYRLKNRLIEDLERSLLLLHHHQDDVAKIMDQVQMANLYRYKTLNEDAFHLLKKAEKNAIQLQRYDLLCSIYEEVTALGMVYDKIPLDTYLEKQSRNLVDYAKFLKNKQLLSHLTHRLKSTNFDSKDPQMTAALEEISQKIQLDEAALKQTRMRFTVSGVVRKVLLQKQDIPALQTHLLAFHQQAQEESWYNKQNHENKILTLVWIVNTYLQSRDFAQALVYTQELYKGLQEHGAILYDKFAWTYFQSLSSGHFYKGEPLKAIEALSTLADDARYQGVQYYDVYLRVNLCLFHYCNGDIKSAFDRLRPLFLRDTYKSLKSEQKLRLSMLELMLHVDEDDWNFVEHLIEDIRRTYRGLFRKKGDAYERERELLKILRKCLNVARPFERKNIREAITKFIKQSPAFTPGGNEMINYTLWLRSKLKKKTYYQLMLKELGVK